MRRLATLVVVLGLLALSVVAHAQTTHQVTIRDNKYNPNEVNATSGDTVRWTNADLERHTVTFSGTSNEVLPGQSITITFQAPGTYRYHCDVHPSMRGTVVVRSASPSSTTTTRAPTTTSTMQEPRGSAITAPPETTTTTTTTTSTTTTSITTTTTVPDDGSGEPSEDVMGDSRPTGTPDNVDGPGAVAALLLLATAGAAFVVTRRAFP